MSEERKPHFWPWITVALVAVLVLYPLSIGPATWLTNRGLLPEWAVDPVESFYAPVYWLFQQSEWSYRLLAWYLDFWYTPDRGGMM